MKSQALAGLTVALLCIGVIAPADTADAATPKKYTSCTQVHRDFSGGIAKPGVTTNRLPNGKRVALGGTVKHSLALYDANAKRLDRDHDGVACEILP